MRPMDECTAEWESAFGLVIFCLSEKTLAALLGRTKPSLLGRTTEPHVDLLLSQFHE